MLMLVLSLLLLGALPIYWGGMVAKNRLVGGSRKNEAT